MSLPNPFHTLQAFNANGASHKFYSIPALEQAGVTVLLPRDWTAQRTTLRPQEAEEEPGERKGSGVGLGAMASFRWRVAVGDTELTEEEIAQIRDGLTGRVALAVSTSFAQTILPAAFKDPTAGGREPGSFPIVGRSAVTAPA